MFNDAIADLPEIAVKVALLVNDTQSSVRQLAMEVMVLLHSLIGDSLLVSDVILCLLAFYIKTYISSRAIWNH